MTRLYKFLSRSNVPCILEGNTVLLSELQHFRQIESSSPWISDKWEGRTVSTHDYVHIRDAASQPHLVGVLDQMGIFVDESSQDIHALGNVLHQELSTQAYILCTSFGAYEDCRRAMCELAPVEARYDACIGISSADDLYIDLLDTGEIVELKNAKMRDVFKGSCHGPVSYFRTTSNVSREAQVHPHPFLKRAFFQEQREYRFVFDPLRYVPKKQLTVRFSPRHGLLSQLL